MIVPALVCTRDPPVYHSGIGAIEVVRLEFDDTILFGVGELSPDPLQVLAVMFLCPIPAADCCFQTDVLISDLVFVDTEIENLLPREKVTRVICNNTRITKIFPNSALLGFDGYRTADLIVYDPAVSGLGCSDRISIDEHLSRCVGCGQLHFRGHTVREHQRKRERGFVFPID